MVTKRPLTEPTAVWRAVLAVLLVVATAVASIQVAGADSGQNMVQVNMFGNRGSARTYNTDIAGEVLGQLIVTGGTGVNPGVWGASLNEVCFPQWVSLWNNFFVGGYQASPYVAKSNVAGACGSFMNVAVVRASAMADRHRQAFATQGASALNNEYKGFTCIRSNYYAQVVCSGHTQSDNQAAADSQLWEYNVHVNSTYVAAGLPLLQGGDFNLAPWQGGQLPGWNYPVETEADANGPSSKGATTDGGQRIDYVFRRSPNSRSSSARITPLSASDHHFYVFHL